MKTILLFFIGLNFLSVLADEPYEAFSDEDIEMIGKQLAGEEPQGEDDGQDDRE